MVQGIIVILILVASCQLQAMQKEQAEQFFCCAAASCGEEMISEVAMSSDGKYLAVGFWGRMVRIWDLHAFAYRQAPCAQLFLGKANNTRKLLFSPNNRYLVSESACSNSIINVWNVSAMLASTESLVRLLPAGDITTAVSAFSPNSRYFAAALHSGDIDLWDLERFTSKVVIPAGPERIIALNVSNNGRSCVSISEKGVIKIWEVAAPQLFTSFAAFEYHLIDQTSQKVSAVTFSPDGQYCAIAVLDEDNRNKIYIFQINITNDHYVIKKRTVLRHACGAPITHLQFIRNAATFYLTLADAAGIVTIWDDAAITAHEKNPQPLLVTQSGGPFWGRVSMLSSDCYVGMVTRPGPVGGYQGTIKVMKRVESVPLHHSP